MTVREHVALCDYTTLRLGGPAARFVEADSDDEILAAVRAADGAGEPLLVLGGGSNLVVADEGFPGTVIRMLTRGIRLAADDDAVSVTVAAGEVWDPLVERCIAEGLSGLECLSGIPGLAGATPIQNVGAYGQDVAETVVAVRAYDRVSGEVVELSNADCGFGYRTSAFKREVIGAAGSGAAGSGAAGSGAAGSGAAGSGAAGSGAAGSGAEGTGSGAAGSGASGLGVAGPGAVTGRFVVLGVSFKLASSPLSAPVRYAELARALGVALGGQVALADARAEVLRLRRRKGMVLDPADPDTRSVGSFFTNPVLDHAQFADLQSTVSAAFGVDTRIPWFAADAGQVKVSAAWLIENAGFAKGYAGAGSGPDDGWDQGRQRPRISAKHTLALVNPGGTTAAALLELAGEIKAGVRAKFGVELVSEPVLVGARI